MIGMNAVRTGSSFLAAALFMLLGACVSHGLHLNIICRVKRDRADSGTPPRARRVDRLMQGYDGETPIRARRVSPNVRAGIGQNESQLLRAMST